MAFSHQTGKQISKPEIAAIISSIVEKYKGRCHKGTVFHIYNCKDDKVFDKWTTTFPLLVVKGQLYALERILGSGAYGKVYGGRNVLTRDKVAIKRQAYHSNPDPMVQKQVWVTAGHGIGLYNPDIVPEAEYLPGGDVYFVLPLAQTNFMKWASQMFREHPCNGWKKVLAAYIKIAEDLEKLHNDHLVHMDLKQDNVLIIDDIAFLSDFGKVERVGKMLPLIKAFQQQYPHNAPEYFVDPLTLVQPQVNNGAWPLVLVKIEFYTVKTSFDSWSFGFMLNKSLKYFPQQVQISLRMIIDKTMNITPHMRLKMADVKKELKLIELN